MAPRFQRRPTPPISTPTTTGSTAATPIGPDRAPTALQIGSRTSGSLANNAGISAARPVRPPNPFLTLLRSPIGRFIINPFTALAAFFIGGKQAASIVLGLIGIREQADAQDAAADANVDIFEGVRDITIETGAIAEQKIEDLTVELNTIIRANTKSLRDESQINVIAGVKELEGLEASGLAKLDTAFAPLIQGLRDLRTRSMDILSDLGDQDRRDITRIFEGLRAEVQADLSERGFGNSNLSLISSAIFGRKEAEALSINADRRALQRIDVDTALTTQLIGAQASLADAGFQFSAGIGQQILGLQGAGRAERLGFLEQGQALERDVTSRLGLLGIEVGLDTGDRLATLIGSQTVNVAPIDFSGIFGGLGAATVKKAELPSAMQNVGNVVLGTIGGAVLGGLGAKRRLGQPRPTKRTGVLPSTGVIG